MLNISFRIISYQSIKYKKAVALREEVLRKPLGLIFQPEELALEKVHIHVAGFKDDELICSAVLVPEGEFCKMQRVVVKEALQNQGIGSKMLNFCEAHAKQCNFKLLYCHARDKAVPFYLKHGYIPEGPYFNEDTIPHLKMQKIL